LNNFAWTRRDLIKLALAAGTVPALTKANDDRMISRPIPATGEQLPVIGLGTYDVFDVDSTADNIAARRAIVDILTERGGSLIDTSPMYDRSENVIGDIIAASDNRSQLFLATKVWTDGKASGEKQMERSARLMNTDVIDLMQVHNLRDLETHMATIRAWQAQKMIRYSGITHYLSSALSRLESAMKLQQPDFIQINYSLGERAAEQRILPLATDLGIAVIINRPFVAGRLFRTIGDTALPHWAASFAASWGQFLLKFIVSHPAVTCVIPATSNVRHMADNLGAGFGRLPDPAERNRMAGFIATL
jgi:diketogulonate reductase-like aldo/keto reductase